MHRYSLIAIPLLALFAATGHAQLGVPQVIESQAASVNAAAPASMGAVRAAVVRVFVPEKQSQAVGSGTLVDVRDQFGLVITNWHVIRDAAGDVTVAFPDGFRSAARVVASDQDWDLAALSIWRPHVAPLRISTQPPLPGEMLGIAGYGSDGKFRLVSGACTQYMAPSEKHPHEIVELATVARQGDSGGPILNQRGELAGVLFGSGGGTTSGSYGGRVSKFLAPLLANTASLSPPPRTKPNPPATNDVVPIVGDHAIAAAPTPKRETVEMPTQLAAPLESLHSVDEDGAILIDTPYPAELQSPFASSGGYSGTSLWDNASPASGGLTLQNVIGHSALEQLKFVLATIGLFTIVVKMLAMGRGSPSAAK